MVFTTASVIAEQIHPQVLADVLAEPVAVIEELLAEAVAAGVLRPAEVQAGSGAS